MKTADLIDEHAALLRLVHLPFRHYGRKPHIFGPVQTVKCFEDNTALRAQLETPGEGRVLVVDAGGSTRIAVLGDMLADLAIANGWEGVVISGAIRDSAEIASMDTLIFALGTSPVKSAKDGLGKVGGPVELGGVRIAPGDWIYADADGVLMSSEKLV
ncbi:putative 4-hydroxy-4-methyl-2-oxoglutarate aldolase [Salipiger pallidus]|uniref:4-hydroxy-4-methyl-2-oxoglutarate aldolase n=1 Tax=Salipiger pallidus TaxID=1775170 RepID=A0A8J3EEX8_9RHOB|nr:ribonuclease E activity regulator RraA [Salipiger pallidus]GGG60354.1 putative 4-hydroxy-4-methyl-2-oxoglutarate aldolase [Salipiger pallidus]